MSKEDGDNKPKFNDETTKKLIESITRANAAADIATLLFNLGVKLGAIGGGPLKKGLNSASFDDALSEMDFVDNEDALREMSMDEVIAQGYKACDHLRKLQEQDE